MTTIIYEKQGYLAHIRLNRPEKLNAVDPTTAQLLANALNDAEQDESIRVVLLSGEGRAFSAGFDLHGGAAKPEETPEDQLRRELIEGFDTIMCLRNCPKPTIAAVHGYCLGSSMELTAVCDFTITSDDCQFGAPEVQFGSGIVCLILPWIVGQKAARELLLCGRKISAQRALDIGLVTCTVAPELLLDTAFELARNIAANDAFAVSMTKRALNRSQDIAGLGEALREALDIDLLIEQTETPESKQFNRILEEKGLKAALAWREQLLGCDNRKENQA